MTVDKLRSKILTLRNRRDQARPALLQQPIDKLRKQVKAVEAPLLEGLTVEDLAEMVLDEQVGDPGTLEAELRVLEEAARKRSYTRGGVAEPKKRLTVKNRESILAAARDQLCERAEVRQGKGVVEVVCDGDVWEVYSTYLEYRFRAPAEEG